MTSALPETEDRAPPRRFDRLEVRVCPERATLGQQAGAAIAAAVRARLAAPGDVRMVLAAAPSQAETLAALLAAPGIDWSRVTLFHMDEFIGLPGGAPQRFARWLEDRVFRHVPDATVHRIMPGAEPEAEAARYSALLAEAPIDIVCAGIGVNGHLAFNDPPVADFDDPLDVKVVEMDPPCRQQQVDDGGFASLDAVPTRAVTLTIPRLMRSGHVFCMVPGRAKAEAVRACLTGPVTTDRPASILRRHPSAVLFVDRESAADA